MRLSRSLALALLLACTPLLACSPADGDRDEREDRPPPPVEALPARSGALPLVEELSGRVRARNQVAIRPEIEATVVEVLVRSGEAVTQGQPLVRLQSDPLLDQLRQAEAELRLARGSAAEGRARVAEVEAQVSRTRALHAEGLMSDMELETQEAQIDAARAQAEQAEAGVEQAQAAVEERRSALSKTTVRAPISGRVGQRNAEPGMLADPSTTLFLIGDFDELIVEVPLTEEMVGHVAEGTPVEVGAQSLEEPIRATVSRISPFLEAGSFSTTGEIDLPNPDGRLRPGMFVSVYVLYGESEQATLVPASALWEDPGTGAQGVYVIEEAQGLEVPETAPGPTSPMPEELRAARFREVEVLAEGRGLAGVRGVSPDEWVVVVGQHLIHQAAQTRAMGLESEGAEEGEQDEDAGVAEAPAPPAPGETTVAVRVRPTTWERVASLQDLQDEDLLRGFLDRHRAASRAFGAEIPEDPHAVDELMDGEGAPSPPGERTPGGS
ncbi:MAG TPA: efflux RND transporter periplasmic adaptor subunit [Thermoanaerobaculia bacterium]